MNGSELGCILHLSFFYNKEPPSSASTGDQTFMQHCEGVLYIFLSLLAIGVFVDANMRHCLLCAHCMGAKLQKIIQNLITLIIK